MMFVDTPIPGAYVLEAARIPDDRGSFEVAFAHEAFKAHGLTPHIEQINISRNTVKGTLRGMHYQESPYAEAKVIRCLSGAIYDVIIDLRPSSPTFCQWHAVELAATNGLALFLPEGVAHGFQTLQDATHVMYTVSAPYTPSHYKGVRWDDPAFGIHWPDVPHRTIHARDRAYPDFIR